MTHSFDCPPGACANVSVIDTALLCNIPVEPYLHPKVPGFNHLNIPTYAFLITSSRGDNVLFDLGIRKDWTELSPVAKREIYEDGIEITTKEDVLDVLEKHKVKGADIDAIILSHHHFDHIGDPSRFPPSTKLVVGKEFKSSFSPGYPTNPGSPMLDTMYEGRELVEINFDNDVKLCGFPAMDYFGDGSLYLLDAPGHSIGHMCALVRTTSESNEASTDTFILLGADACHHVGEFRPSEHFPLPDQIVPHPFLPTSPLPCPGHGFKRYLESNRTLSSPFFDMPTDLKYAEYVHDMKAARNTICNIQAFDKYENVFIIIAHDRSLQHRIKFFPENVNDWASLQYSSSLRWAFLEDFPALVKASLD